MTNSSELTRVEKQWLLAISRGPLKKVAADRSVSAEVLENLAAKRLVKLQGDAVELTAKGDLAAALLRSV